MQYLNLSRLWITRIVYKSQFVPRIKHITSRFKKPVKHDYVFRSAQIIKRSLLQNFQNKAKYSEIRIHTMVIIP